VTTNFKFILETVNVSCAVNELKWLVVLNEVLIGAAHLNQTSFARDNKLISAV
jgi:hypothetical protein